MAGHVFGYGIGSPTINPQVAWGANPYGVPSFGSQVPTSIPQIVQLLQFVPQQLQRLQQLHYVQVQELQQLQQVLQIIPQQIQQLQFGQQSAFLPTPGLGGFGLTQPQIFSAQPGQVM
jgi:hypothetical protein